MVAMVPEIASVAGTGLLEARWIMVRSETHSTDALVDDDDDDDDDEERLDATCRTRPVPGNTATATATMLGTQP